jgi:hypothetical protein
MHFLNRRVQQGYLRGGPQRSNSKCRIQRKNVKGRKTEVYDLSELENEEK